MRPLVMYDGHDTDGFCGAWLFHKFFNGEVDFIALDHYDPPPDVEDRVAFLVDMSFPKDQMDEMAKSARDFHVFDHHENSRECADQPYMHWDDQECGASLVDKWITGNSHLTNWIVQYVRDRDLWLKELEWTEEVSATIRAHPREFDSWNELELAGIQSAKKIGSYLVNERNVYVKQKVRHAFNVLIDYSTWMMAVNAPMLHCSDLCNAIVNEYNRPAICFVLEGDTWKYSLRSRYDLPAVDKYAASQGGGGHRNASGFKLPRLIYDIKRVLFQGE